MELTSVQITPKDLEFLKKIKRQTRTGGMWAVIEKVIKLIKHHKLENEIR